MIGWCASRLKKEQDRAGRFIWPAFIADCKVDDMAMQAHFVSWIRRFRGMVGYKCYSMSSGSQCRSGRLFRKHPFTWIPAICCFSPFNVPEQKCRVSIRWLSKGRRITF